jgi:hypothetical protein
MSHRIRRNVFAVQLPNRVHDPESSARTLEIATLAQLIGPHDRIDDRVVAVAPDGASSAEAIF